MGRRQRAFPARPSPFVSPCFARRLDLAVAAMRRGGRSPGPIKDNGCAGRIFPASADDYLDEGRPHPNQLCILGRVIENLDGFAGMCKRLRYEGTKARATRRWGDMNKARTGRQPRRVRRTKAGSKKRSGRGAEVIRRLRGSGTVKMTTDEVMALTRDK
jgi:hypothetical protein